MAQFMRPNGDYSEIGGWIPEPFDTTIWNVMDEASPNDSDYAWIDGISSSVYFFVDLSSPGTTPGSGDHIIRVRAAKIDGGKDVELFTSLVQRDPLVYVVGARQSLANPLPDTWGTYLYTLTQGQVDLITNYDSLQVEVGVWAPTGKGKAPDPAISWIEFEVPDGGGVPSYIPKVIMIT